MGETPTTPAPVRGAHGQPSLLEEDRRLYWFREGFRFPVIAGGDGTEEPLDVEIATTNVGALSNATIPLFRAPPF